MSTEFSSCMQPQELSSTEQKQSLRTNSRQHHSPNHQGKCVAEDNTAAQTQKNLPISNFKRSQSGGTGGGGFKRNNKKSHTRPGTLSGKEQTTMLQTCTNTKQAGLIQASSPQNKSMMIQTVPAAMMNSPDQLNYSSELYQTPANNHEANLQYSQGRDKVHIEWSIAETKQELFSPVLKKDVAANSQQQTLKRRNNFKKSAQNNNATSPSNKSVNLNVTDSFKNNSQANSEVLQQSKKEIATLKREITKLQRKITQMEESKPTEIQEAVDQKEKQLRTEFDSQVKEIEEENQIIQESKIETITSDLKIQFDEQIRKIQQEHVNQLQEIQQVCLEQLNEKDQLVQQVKQEMEEALSQKDQEITNLNDQIQQYNNNNQFKTLERPSTALFGPTSERVNNVADKRLQSPKTLVSNKKSSTANVEFSKSTRKKKVLELNTNQQTLSTLNGVNQFNPSSGNHTSPNRKTPKQLLSKFQQPSKSPAIFRQSFEQEPTKRIETTGMYPSIKPANRYRFDEIQIDKQSPLPPKHHTQEQQNKLPLNVHIYDHQEQKQMFSAVRETVEEQNGASENAEESGYQHQETSWNSSDCCSAIEDDLDEEAKQFGTLSKVINSSYMMNLKRNNLNNDDMVVHATHKINSNF